MDGFGIRQNSTLTEQEQKLFEAVIAANQQCFAWKETERRRFRDDYFPPLKLAVLPHTPWTQRHIPIPPSIKEQLITLLRDKIAAGVYEECNSSYRNPWFCVIKKDGTSLRIVHDLQRLNEHTIRDAGLIPQPDEFSEECAGYTLLSVFDLYSSYDLQKLHPDYRDLTAFQSPVGVLRNVALPQGYTNAVPIQQANVQFILLNEIPTFANSFVDDVVAKGTRSYYILEDGTYETHPDNPGIRRFVWEHAVSTNRILHRLGRAGASVSGKKAVVAAPEAVIVGKLCSFEGRHPDKSNVEKIAKWPKCENTTQVRAFLGTCGVSKLWIKDYARVARPLYDLTKKGVDFNWSQDCDIAMTELKRLVMSAPALKPIDYSSLNDVILAVDSSYIGVGFILLQLGDDKKRYPSRYGAITWNEREARYSQAKLELHGLFRALRAVRMFIYGVLSLVVEIDAKYIKGMLNNPDMQPNAVINRWIAGILLFNPRLVHIPATKHTGADGLSRRPHTDDDDPEPDDAEDWLDDALGFAIERVNARVPPYAEREPPQVLPGFAPIWYPRTAPAQVLYAETFVVTRSGKAAGTQQSKAPRGGEALPQQESESDSDDSDAEPMAEKEEIHVEQEDETDDTPAELPSELQGEVKIPRGRKGIKRDAELPKIRDFLDKGERDADLTREQLNGLVRKAAGYFVLDGILYKRNNDGRHKVVILDNDRRLKVMAEAHDELGHKGYFPVRTRVRDRFFWHDMDTDIRWYLRTCHQCQIRRVGQSRIPQAVPFVPGLFFKIHLDVVYMSVESEGKKYLVHARCAMAYFPEWRALAKINGTTIGRFIFEELICRYGALFEIVTDNGPEVREGLNWIDEKYHIRHIRISAYNSRANGIIESPHFGVRESLMKACGGSPRKWASKAYYVFWAERITTRRHLGMSPYQMAYGCEPVMPLDFEEATWLVPPLQVPISTQDMIVARARQLEKRASDIAAMRKRIKAFRQDAADRMNRTYKGLKAPQCVQPGTLVLVKNTRIETEHNRKHKQRWLGPYIVLRQHGGTFQGSYILAELDRSVIIDRVAAARIRLYWPRHDVKYSVSRIIEETPQYVWERATAPQPVDHELPEEEEDATAGLPEPLVEGEDSP